MTDAEWAACTDPWKMLGFLQSRASERKLRLFAVACCRRAWHLMTDPRHRHAVEAAEKVADGLLDEKAFDEAMQPIVALWAALSDATEGDWRTSGYMTATTRHLETGKGAADAASFAARGLACLAGLDESPPWYDAWRAEAAAQCRLLRDLFGNPFYPFRFDPRWLAREARAAVDQARMIYQEEKFESLPSLADMLEQAGCRDQVVLDHCREPASHACGCWVVDALLEREPAVRTGLLTVADWQTCADPEPLLHFLLDKGNLRKWRLFAVACCQRICHLMTDERSRRAVEIAERYAEGDATEEDLEAARAAAQEAQEEAKEAEYWAESEANFGMTPKYAVACCRLYAACAARSAVCHDPRKADAEPGTFEADSWHPSNMWAASAIEMNVRANFESVQEEAWWDEARSAGESAEDAELQIHCDFLRDLFGEYLGPPVEEGRWLPCGLERREHPLSPAERWCLLPTPRSLTLRAGWLVWNDGTIPRLAQAIYEEQAFDRLPLLADALEDVGCDRPELLEHLRRSQVHARGCWVLDLLRGAG